MKLIRKPKKPDWKTFVNSTLPDFPEKMNWQEFLDMAYWNIELEED